VKYSEMSGNGYQARDSEGIMCAITLSDNRSHPSILETRKNEEVEALTGTWEEAPGQP